MNMIEGTGATVVEPEWESLFSDEPEIAAAREHWRVITTELKDRQVLAAANAHSVQRLVCAYLMFDRIYREVAGNGVVTKPRRDNSKAIARISRYFTAMREAGSDAATIEAELGISRDRARQDEQHPGRVRRRLCDDHQSLCRPPRQTAGENGKKAR